MGEPPEPLRPSLSSSPALGAEEKKKKKFCRPRPLLKGASNATLRQQEIKRRKRQEKIEAQSSDSSRDAHPFHQPTDKGSFFSCFSAFEFFLFHALSPSKAAASRCATFATSDSEDGGIRT
jgi:hypothetical protein